MSARHRNGETPLRVAVLHERLRIVEDALPELRADVKAVLALVTELKVGMATRPAREDWERLVSEVDRLRAQADEIRGGWRVTAWLFAGLASVFSAIVTLLVTRVWGGH